MSKNIFELKPCPFCGGEAKMIEAPGNVFAGQRTIYRVECKKGIECPGMAGTRGYDTEREAAAAWNTRAPQAAMSKKHKLKILPEFFKAVNDGSKTFELRENDRGYKTGDILILQEFDGENYTGREVSREVLYIYEGAGLYGLAPGYCILAIKGVDK